MNKPQKVIIEDATSDHSFMVWYPAYLLWETEDAWKVWHWWRHPFTRTVRKNSMDYQVKKDDPRL